MSFVKSAEHWLFFDDELVEPMTEQLVQTAFGSTQVTRPTCSYSLWNYWTEVADTIYTLLQGFVLPLQYMLHAIKPNEMSCELSGGKVRGSQVVRSMRCDVWGTQDYSNTMEHGYILMYERQPCNGAC